MPVFISYSHADKPFVNMLGVHLVRRNANVWIDTWELSVGDSILNRVQDAIQESGALLVVLSKSSVASEWCKKELSGGLMRELAERRVVVLPVLIEDCEMPIFLREKMYADFRTDFNHGLHCVLDAIAKITNANQSRIENDDRHVDWSQDWGFSNGSFHLRFTIVESPKSLRMTFLTQIYVFCNEIATSRYQQYEAAGLDWIGRALIADTLFDSGKEENYHLILDSQFPQVFEMNIADPKTGSEYEVIIESRKMGQDNGKDQVIYVSNYLMGIQEYVHSVNRKPTQEELQLMREIVIKPRNA